MPHLDAYLRNELRGTIRPIDVNDVSSRIDLRRTRRTRLRKIQAMALTVVVLAGTLGVAAVMTTEFRNAGTEPLAATPEPQSEDIGFGFPVCDVKTSFGNWGGNGSVVYLATRTNDGGGCPTPDDGASQVVGLDDDGNGKIDVSLGQIQCLASCRFFAAPDIDKDGKQELAIAQGVNGSSGSIRIFSVNTDGEPALVPWQEGGKDLEFAWDTSNDHLAGAFCDEGRAGPEFVVWNAERIGPGHYRESRVRYHMDGTTLGGDGVHQPHMETIEVPDDEPLLPRLDKFCRTTLNASWGGY